MNDALQPSFGQLEAKIIRACPTHLECSLECPERQVEDVGTVASFDHRSLVQRLKEVLHL